MSNQLHSKLGEGLFKVQGGIEQGKQKLQVSQEVSRLKREVSEASTAKSKILLEVGQLTYKKMRTGEVNDEELKGVTNRLLSLDHTIYQATFKIHELNAREGTDNGITCPNCEMENDEHAKFCGGCGDRIEKKVVSEEVDFAHCDTCEEAIPKSSNFCPCCGMKVIQQ